MPTKETPAHIVSLREEMRARVIKNIENASLSLSEGDNLFVKHLPNGITQEQAKTLEHYRQDFVAETADVVRENVAAMVKENADIKQVNFEMPMLTTRDKVQVMASTTEGMKVAMLTAVTNPKAGRLKEVLAVFSAEMDELNNASETV